MRLAISKSLFLSAIAIGLVIGANGSAEAYPQISAQSDHMFTSESGLQYLAQFSGRRNRPDLDEDDFEDRLDDMEDRREDMEDHFDDMEDRREDMEDWRDDRAPGPRRFGPGPQRPRSW